jgi:hypothetical protein
MRWQTEARDSADARLGGIRPGLRTSLSIAVLLAINVYVSRDLFTAEFIHQMGSVEGSFIAISRWMIAHWGDLKWFPLWFTGMPFLKIYQPGFHAAVAGAAVLAHWTPQHAYHVVNALVYCLQPVTLFWLCYRITGSRGYGFAAALVYSLLSPSAFLSTVIRDDLGGLWFARRYQTLVHYGEGPHNLALLLIPLAILFLHRAVVERRSAYLPLACLMLAAIGVSNWPGTIGLAMAIAAYAFSRAGGKPRLHWGLLAAAGAIAYLIACRWIPPSIVLSVPANAQQSDGTNLRNTNLLYLGAALLALAGIHFLFERYRVDRWLRFFLYFGLFSGAVSLGNYWFGFSLLPQPHRFHVEMEIGVIGAGVYLSRLAYLRSPGWFRTAALAALALGAIWQIHTYRVYAHGQTLPEDISATLEYRMSKWFDEHMPGARVFAPGSVSIWANTFVDVPQVVGCCDQGVPSFQHRLAYFIIYTGHNSGDKYVPASLLWLKAYGAQAVGIGGAHGKEFFKAFARPEAFRGILPELWREGDDAIYQIPTPQPSLAHVMEPSQLINRSPVHGLDTDPLVPYVAAIERADAPQARFRWVNQHQARIEADSRRGQVLSVQISYDPGWRASVNGVRKPVRADGIGLMVVEPGCDGKCAVDLDWSGGRETRWTVRAQVLGLVLCLAWPIVGSWKRRRTQTGGAAQTSI